MVRRPPGTTLAETLVVVLLFSLLMVLILGFYIEGSRVSSRQDKYSASYRRALQVLDRVETLLAFARVWSVQADSVVFSPRASELSLARGLPDWGPAASTLVVRRDPPALLIREGGVSRTFLELSSWDRVSFGGSETGTVSVTALSRPPLDRSRGEGEARVIQCTRRILVENDGLD